ncbi:hypothetical protein F5Y17DRAFT_416542 [Xylariaceae sp. FL0594]|nr:hypothetical protein F5Y17DRAFT_416542 [Xylariaceae sp. FL0594]
MSCHTRRTNYAGMGRGRDDPLKFAEIISNLNHHVSQLGVSQSTELAKYHSELQQAMEIYRDGSGLVINDKLGLLLEQRDLFAVLGPTVSLLKELRFEGIYDREDAIKPPIQGTFSMDESEEDRENVIQSLVLPWLRSGSGVLHISGKAGSGKSTLMKQMVTHPCTRQSLEAWAGDGELLYAAFFFWAPGNKEEKSMNGLRRSLLYRILSHNTALIPEFQDTFSTTTPGRCRQQIHLHTLNEPEIEKHCQHVFQKAQEEFPVLSGALKELGHDFARQLASRAEGVFLWAVLVARMLISEAKRGGSRDDLERKLKETPDDMNELYDKMFNLLQPSYRQFSNRLLLLVLTNPFRHDVSALCVKQLASKDTWQSGIPDSFTYQDAVSDIEYVEKHLDVLTQGLIEVVKSNQSDDSNLLDKTRLKLFHKTAWDYLRYSRLSELQSGYADFGPENIHSTLRLKELAVVKRIDIRYYNKCLHNYSYEMLETKRVERVGLARNQIGYFELTEAAIHDLQGLEINT